MEIKATAYSNDPAKDRLPLIGKEGVTMTHLHPTGRIRVGAAGYDAVADGSFIETGEPVRVVGTRDFRLVVERTR